MSTELSANALEIFKALEKQQAKEPSLEGDSYGDSGELIFDTWTCPTCEMSYEIDCDVYDYCPKCGQRIDNSVFREPKDEMHKNHIKMWNWLSEHPDKQKRDYLNAHNIAYNSLLSMCYACTECKMSCARCPLNWGDENCNHPNGLYKRWLNSANKEERSKLAKQIAKLEWRPK